MGQPKLFSIIDKACYDYKLIEEGDNILIGASGGKDSTALVQYFAARQKQHRENFTFTALHVESGIGSPLNPDLVALFNSWGVEPVTVQADVLGRLKPGQKMNCWWCSTQRRTELNNYAIEHHFNKIALGHHLDDILETVLMNALVKGELSTMPPRLQYEKYPVEVIRPLCYADVQTIIRHSNEAGFINATCTCTYQDNSGRKSARSKLELLTGGSLKEKQHLFNALRNVRTEYLP